MDEKMYNFSAGPGTLPDEVLQEAHRQLLDYQSSGLSILELGHRTQLFEETYNEARHLVRELLQIPDAFEVLLLQGGATLQQLG